jgi:hypothetical protein
MCSAVIGETGDRGERRDDAVFTFVTMVGETTHAKQLLLMDVFVFNSSTIRYAKCIQKKDESCILDPRRFTKRW